MMKDKDKQIEEIAKIANFTAFDYRQGTIQSKTIYTAIAEAIYKYITENLVVLSREEYEKLLESNKNLKYSFDTASNYIEKLAESCEKNCKKFNGITTQRVSKETAEKCRDFVKQWVGNSDEGLGFLFDFEDFIAKQLCVEIKE